MDRFSINGMNIKQPSGCSPNWETTYTEDSGRVMTGMAELDPMFTVESYSLEWTWVTPEEASQILQAIIPTQNNPHFTMHYFSWRLGRWTDGTFYVGKGSLNVATLEDDYEHLDKISCNVIGVNPI